jgi:ubiquinone/menaquinone biosynthesis C-methylase UbiE
MSDEHPQITEDQIYFLEPQEVSLDDFGAAGYILDIGGGGEGIIGRLKGQQVIAVDPNRRELEEAAEGPLKIVMDARDLKFLDGAFNTVTSFFALMYIQGPDHEAVLREVFRVLAPGGRFLIWDVILPRCLDESKVITAFRLSVELPGETVSTGYGARWPEREQDLAYYRRLAEAVGFEVLAQRERGRTFFLELGRP